MTKRTRPKKSAKKSSRRVRKSASHVRGWVTRRAHAEARSRRAKKAARTRRKRFYLKRQRDTKPVNLHPDHTGKLPLSVEPEPLRDFILSMSYRGRKGHRHFDFVASATSETEAFEQLYEAEPWTKHIPWQKVTIARGPIVTQNHPVLKRGERKSLPRKRTKSKSTLTGRTQSRRSTRKRNS